MPAGETALPDALIKIAVAGALGRMGRQMALSIAADPRLALVAQFDRADQAPVEPLVARQAAIGLADVIIDFTTPAASVELAEICAANGGPRLVLGATGFDAIQIARIDAAAEEIAIVRAGNFSLGLNLVNTFVEQAARVLGPADYDIAVFEAHHRHKVDAPSGAALMLGAAAARGRGVDLDKVAQRGRDGITGARTAGDIGFSVMRGGGIVGEHSVTFAAEDEVLTLSHSARDRSLFARGAAAAAAWVAGRPAGAYDMRDVLGFSRD